jgi:hypothetical protein
MEALIFVLTNVRDKGEATNEASESCQHKVGMRQLLQGQRGENIVQRRFD